jgi:hypothetical protein
VQYQQTLLIGDWKECVDKPDIADKQNLAVKDEYQVMLDFLESYFSRFFKDLDIIFTELIEVKNKTKGNHLTWGDWLECVRCLKEINGGLQIIQAPY